MVAREASPIGLALKLCDYENIYEDHGKLIRESIPKAKSLSTTYASHWGSTNFGLVCFLHAFIVFF